MRAIGPLLVAIFLFGLLVGVILPRVPQGVAGAGLLGVALFLVWAMHDGLRGIESFFKGARGEEMVALLLAALPGGYHVFHDVSCGESGGIDHVVVGPNGLFVIETKCWSGKVTLEGGVLRVDGELPSRPPIPQALGASHALATFLAERLESVPERVTVVCFASNTLVRSQLNFEDTVVCNATALLAVILGHAGHVTPDDVERIVKVMERKAS
jgi:hypothetical protein